MARRRTRNREGLNSDAVAALQSDADLGAALMTVAEGRFFSTCLTSGVQRRAEGCAAASSCREGASCLLVLVPPASPPTPAAPSDHLPLSPRRLPPFYRAKRPLLPAISLPPAVSCVVLRITDSPAPLPLVLGRSGDMDKVGERRWGRRGQRKEKRTVYDLWVALVGNYL